MMVIFSLIISTTTLVYVVWKLEHLGFGSGGIERLHSSSGPVQPKKSSAGPSNDGDMNKLLNQIYNKILDDTETKSAISAQLITDGIAKTATQSNATSNLTAS